MSDTNRKFNWDFDSLKRFYNTYVYKWLNAAMNWTAAQKKQARANLGFGNGDIDDEPTAESENLVKSGGIKNYVDNHVSVSQNTPTGTNHTRISVGGNDYDVASVEDVNQLEQELLKKVVGTNPHGLFWDFNYRVTSGVEVMVMRVGGDSGAICVGSQSGPALPLNQLVSFIPNTTGNCYLTVSGISAATNAPIIYFASPGSSLQAIEALLQSEINEVAQDISGQNDSRSISVSSGAQSHSRTNLYNGAELAANSYIKIKVVQAEGLVSKVRFVDSGWGNVGGAYLDFVDGQEFVIKLSRSTISLGLYLDAEYVVGTGTLKFEVSVNYDKSLNFKIEKLQDEFTDLQEEVNTLPIVEDVLFDMPNRKGTASLNFANAISNVRVWGLKQNHTIGLSSYGPLGDTQKQFFFNIIEPDGTSHGCYANIQNSNLNLLGKNYITIYRNNLTFYPSYSDDSIKPTEIRFVIDLSVATPGGSYSPTSDFLPFSERVCNEFPNPYTIIRNGLVEDVYITCKRTGTSGVDADFCGLNAIGDAVSSISDASSSKQYHIMVSGHFLFTNPKMVDEGGDFKYYVAGEPTPVFTKKWVIISGIDKDNAVVEVSLDASLDAGDFALKEGSTTERLTFTDYQPVYILYGSSIKNMTFIGKNCRYTAHIEVGGNDNGCEIKFDSCTIISKISTKGYKSCMTIGEIPYFSLLMNNCDFINENETTLFSGHTPLYYVTNGRENCNIEFDGCNFMTPGIIGLGTYHYNRKDIQIFKNCKFFPTILVTNSADSSSKREIGSLVEQKFDSPALCCRVRPTSACGLRITTITGTGSSVRFDPTCSAFGIVGNANEPTEYSLPYSAIKTCGYEYKDDPQGNHAYACGWVNIDPVTGNSLGSILGDCSSINKTLKVTINGTDYSIVFNTDLTSETNDNIIAAINAVIGSVATCDTFNPEIRIYPDFAEEEYYVVNNDNAVIEMGMGVVKNGVLTMRRAKQTDGYIDGIAVDTIYPGQRGRIIRNGRFYNLANSGGDYYYQINPVLSLSAYGTKISIDPDNDGKFIVSSAAPVLKYIGYNIVEII